MSDKVKEDPLGSEDPVASSDDSQQKDDFLAKRRRRARAQSTLMGIGEEGPVSSRTTDPPHRSGRLGEAVGVPAKMPEVLPSNRPARAPLEVGASAWQPDSRAAHAAIARGDHAAEMLDIPSRITPVGVPPAPGVPWPLAPCVPNGDAQAAGTSRPRAPAIAEGPASSIPTAPGQCTFPEPQGARDVPASMGVPAPPSPSRERSASTSPSSEWHPSARRHLRAGRVDGRSDDAAKLLAVPPEAAVLSIAANLLPQSVHGRGDDRRALTHVEERWGRDVAIAIFAFLAGVAVALAASAFLRSPTPGPAMTAESMRSVATSDPRSPSTAQGVEAAPVDKSAPPPTTTATASGRAPF